MGVLYETAYYIELLDSLPVFGGVGVDHLFRDFFYFFLFYCLFSDDGFNVHFQIRVPWIGFMTS